jgi:hypothetical protein
VAGVGTAEAVFVLSTGAHVLPMSGRVQSVTRFYRGLTIGSASATARSPDAVCSLRRRRIARRRRCPAPQSSPFPRPRPRPRAAPQGLLAVVSPTDWAGCSKTQPSFAGATQALECNPMGAPQQISYWRFDGRADMNAALGHWTKDLIPDTGAAGPPLTVTSRGSTTAPP